MWEWRDGWILQAIGYAGRRGALRSVIADADAINVEIPDRKYWNVRCDAWRVPGLVQAGQGRLRATRAGKRVVGVNSRWRDGIRSITPKIERRCGSTFRFLGASGTGA